MVIFKAVVFPFVIALLIGCLYSCFTERDSSTEKLSDQDNQLSALEPLQCQPDTQVSFPSIFKSSGISSTTPFSQFHPRLLYITHLGNNVLRQLSQNSADTPNEHQQVKGFCYE